MASGTYIALFAKGTGPTVLHTAMHQSLPGHSRIRTNRLRGTGTQALDDRQGEAESRILKTGARVQEGDRKEIPKDKRKVPTKGTSSSRHRLLLPPQLRYLLGPVRKPA